MDDLFAPAVRGPHTGRNAPETSREAAATIEPRVGSIRSQVLAHAERVGEVGFIDEELAYLASDERQFDRSIRNRRTELTDANMILDSRRRRPNARGNECVVWIHRLYATNPPPISEGRAKVGPTGPDYAAGREWVAKLRRYGATQTKAGATFLGDELVRAAEVMERLLV